MAAVLCAAVSIGAQPASRGVSPPANYGKLGQPDAAEGRRALEAFRAAGIQGDYYLEFELRLMPRRGEEKRIAGAMWGARNRNGPVSRVVLAAPAALRLLVQNGREPAVWRWSPGELRPQRVDAKGLMEPIAGTTLTAFDLQMPFLYWTDFVYEGVSRVRGRPAHRFRMLPPAELARDFPALAAVRVSLDSQFDALVQAELLDADGRVMKSILVDELKKIGDQWMVKAVDVRDERTRDKTRFEIQAVALHLDFAPGLFSAEMLRDDVPAPSTPLQRIGP